MTPPPLLELASLRVSFGDERHPLHAVDGVDLAVDRGEVLGVVGESGSGKSQLLRAIMRAPPRGARLAGTVRWRGTDLATLPERERRAVRGRLIAFVPQDPFRSLNGVLTVGAQIDETLRAHGMVDAAARRRRAIELLDTVGIARARERLGEHPHRFSGGMLQRVLIAIAISADPALLLADEPTTALDVTVQEEILALLLALQARTGMAMILVSHDVGVVARAASRVAVMYAGRVVETATAASLLATPAHPYTRGLLGSVPGRTPPRTPLRAIDGRAPALDERPEGCAFRPRCPDARGFCAERVPVLLPRAGGRASACLRQDELDRSGCAA